MLWLNHNSDHQFK